MDLYSPALEAFDLGFERAGMEIAWQVEIDKHCQKLLRNHFQGPDIYGDIKTCEPRGSIDLLAGGDPCPSRSSAKFGMESQSPDLSGYFLAMVGRLRPRWVVRENVCAPDVGDFAAALELLGYTTVIIQLNAKDFTAQHRRRQFIVGLHWHWADSGALLSHFQSHCWNNKKIRKAEEANTSCILTNRWNNKTYTNYVYEGSKGIRILTNDECERLQGFPPGWTDGFSVGVRRRMIANAVPPPFAEWIGRQIMKYEEELCPKED